MFKLPLEQSLEVHVIELAEWSYSEVVQANKTRGNNENLHSMASTRLGITILTLAQHPFMITEVDSISFTDKQRPRHNWHRTSSGIISKVSCRIF